MSSHKVSTIDTNDSGLPKRFNPLDDRIMPDVQFGNIEFVAEIGIFPWYNRGTFDTDLLRVKISMFDEEYSKCVKVAQSGNFIAVDIRSKKAKYHTQFNELIRGLTKEDKLSNYSLAFKYNRIYFCSETNSNIVYAISRFVEYGVGGFAYIERNDNKGILIAAVKDTRLGYNLSRYNYLDKDLIVSVYDGCIRQQIRQQIR